MVEHMRKSGTGYEARCPGPRHRRGDHRASLSLSTGYDGRVLLNCKAGCETPEVLEALGLTWGDLFEHSDTGNVVKRFKLQDLHGETVAYHVREDAPDGKRLRWERNGHPGLDGLPTADLPLYRLPDVQAETSPLRPVVVCEGEKAADALADLGLLAVATVTGASGTPSETSLAPLQWRDVWLWPDSDEVGREHMARIATRLKRPVRWVVWPASPDGGDAADYVAQGGTADGVAALVQDTGAPVVVLDGPRIWTAPELASAHFQPPRWAIPELLPSGLTILAGRPKLGKSWIALGWALDIAAGAAVLRSVQAETGETLYLGLEDGPRRLQERVALMLGEIPHPPRMHLATDWPRTDEGGIDLLSQWLTQHPRTRLIVVDTFKRIRPIEKGVARLYDLDYDAIAPLASLAQTYNVACVLVFHTRKGESTDPLESVSGTLGLSGAADCVMVLRRERGQADASLFITGRDVEEQDLALRFERDDVFGWSLLGDAEQFRRSRERQNLLDLITTVPGATPKDMADALGKTAGSVRYLLFRMVRDEEVRLRDGRYYVTANTPNTENSPNRSNANNALHVPPSNGHATEGISPVPVSDTRDMSPVSTVSGVSGPVMSQDTYGRELPF